MIERVIEKRTDMPDGSIIIADPIASACARMHERLICWGRLRLAGGNGPRQRWDSDDEREHFDYNERDYDDSLRVGSLVWQLPKPQQRIVLGQFYVNDKICSVWHQMSQPRRDQIASVMVDRINAAIRDVNDAEGRILQVDKWLTITADDIDGIRERAIRMLVNRERVTQGLATLPNCR